MFRILPTDIFVYLLLAAVIIFILSARRQEYWRTAWKQVQRNPVAMTSLVILLLYTSIAVLDTIHYEDLQTGTTLSMLDRIAAPLREKVEKTYSAPFATHLYNRTGDIRLVQLALRHEHLATTEVYAQIDPKRLRAAVGAEMTTP